MLPIGIMLHFLGLIVVKAQYEQREADDHIVKAREEKGVGRWESGRTMRSSIMGS